MPGKVHIWPSFGGVDEGDGGVRRVVEGQRAGLAAHGWQVVDRAEDADLIASHITVPETYLVRYPEKPLVAHCHGLYWAEYEWPNWAIKANVQVMQLIRDADVVTAPTEWVAQTVRRAASRDVRVVPHGVDVDRWKPSTKPGRYVLWNKTRPDPVCDPAVVEALAAAMPDVEFRSTFGKATSNLTIIGREPYAAARETVRRAGAYLATVRETFGIGTLEAMAAGVPVVGWRWGGQIDLVEHEVDGWLAAPGDVAGLAEGVQWALANRHTAGAQARRKAATFSWERACAAYARIYDEVQARTSATSSPRTSIVVTAYDLERYLPDCLDSVLAQTDPNWECIVVDDSSPDRCGAIAEEYAARDRRFRVVHNQANQYLAGARNTGIRAARGRYVLPLDADDMLAPLAVEVLAQALDRDRSVHVAYGNVEFLEPDGSRWHSGWPMAFQHENQLQKRNLLPYSSMFRREAWRLVGGYRERFRTAEDADLWCRLTSYGFQPRMVTQQDTLVYRNREGSMSRVEAARDWTVWFPWARDARTTPAGAGTQTQLPVPSLDPPAVTVVIPVGPGHGQLVHDAVDSVDAQTFRQWEVVVVNDSGEPLAELPSWVRVCCGDRTCPCGDGAPCRYQDAPGSPAMAYQARGAAAARNKGVSLSRARLYVPLDADDLLEPRALALLLEAHAEHGDIAYGDFWEDPEEEGRFRVWTTPDWDPRLLVFRREAEGHPKGCECSRCWPGGAVAAVTQLVPVEVWREVGGYDESLEAWEDWAFQIACAARGYCSRRVTAPVFTYRKHTGARRRENYADFDRSKAAILKRFGAYFEKGAELMACKTCGGGGRTASFVPPDPFASTRKAPEYSEAVLMEFTSDASGATTFRAPSNTSYRFANGDKKYVRRVDVDWFLARAGFAVIDPRENLALGPGDGPTLAEGVRRGAEPVPTFAPALVPAAEESPLASIVGQANAEDDQAPRGRVTTATGRTVEVPPGASLDDIVAAAGRAPAPEPPAPAPAPEPARPKRVRPSRAKPKAPAAAAAGGTDG